MREGDRETLALLNEGLAIVMANGVYRHLHSKWFASMQLPSDRPIIVGGDLNYPPYEYLDETGNPAGYNVDITRAIAREMGLNVEIRLGAWSEQVQALENGKIDILQGMFYSPARDLKFDFTQPHTVSHYVSVVRKGEGEAPSSINELKNKRIVVQKEDTCMILSWKTALKNRYSLFPTRKRRFVNCLRVNMIVPLFLLFQRIT